MNRDKDVLNSDVLPISLFDTSSIFDNVFLTKEEKKAIRDEIGCYESLQSLVIEVLKIVQKRCGWISDQDVVSVARILRMSVSDVEAVATFYSQIFRQPVGRHIIRFCDSVVCYITGCQNIRLSFENFLGIKQGETTQDNRFTFLPISCLGKCDKSPVIMIDEDIHICVLSENIKKILERYL